MGVFPCIYDDSGNHNNVHNGANKHTGWNTTIGELWFSNNTTLRTDRVLNYKPDAAYECVREMTSYDDGMLGFCNV